MKEEYKDLLFTPSQAATAHLQWAEQIASNEGTTWGLPDVDAKVVPERPGEMVCVLARPGHGKSSILAYRTLHESKEIEKAQMNGERKGEIVLYVTFDDSVEEIENFFLQGFDGISSTDVAWGRADIESIKRRAMIRSRMPIWIMGHSIMRSAKHTGKVGIRLTPDVLFDAVEQLQESYSQTEFPINYISMLCIDYIQRMPVPGTSTRMEEVTEAIHRVKELAVRLGTRIIVGVQASRAVDNREFKIPEMGDSQHSSAIEQDASKIFSLWRPWLTELSGVPQEQIIIGPNGYKMITNQNKKAYIEMGKSQYLLTDTLVFLQLLKQKGDSGRALWPLFFDPAYLKLANREEDLVQREENFGTYNHE